MVGDITADQGGDDLAAQTMLGDLGCISLAEHIGKVRDQAIEHEGIVRDIRSDDRFEVAHLAECEQYSNFGFAQALPQRQTFRQCLLVRKPLEPAVKAAALFQEIDEARLFVKALRPAGGHQAYRQSLRIVVGQHQPCHIVCHLGQQQVALLGRQVATGDQLVEQYLDVDLMIRTIDTG